MKIEIVRIYEHKEASDNIRILVDRLWSCAIAKKDAHLDYNKNNGRQGEGALLIKPFLYEPDLSLS